MDHLDLIYPVLLFLMVQAENSLLQDIAVKTNSLDIDNRCMSRRQQFKYRSPNK